MIAVLRSTVYIRRYWRLFLLAFISLTSATLLARAVPQILRYVIDQGLPQPFITSVFTPRFLAQGLQIILSRPQLIFSSVLLRGRWPMVPTTWETFAG